MIPLLAALAPAAATAPAASAASGAMGMGGMMSGLMSGFGSLFSGLGGSKALSYEELMELEPDEQAKVYASQLAKFNSDQQMGISGTGGGSAPDMSQPMNAASLLFPAQNPQRGPGQSTPQVNSYIQSLLGG